MGASPPNPLENKNKKDSYPSPLSAFREQRGGKGKRKECRAPLLQTRLKIKKIQTLPELAHRIQDTTQPGQGSFHWLAIRTTA